MRVQLLHRLRQALSAACLLSAVAAGPADAGIVTLAEGFDTVDPGTDVELLFDPGNGLDFDTLQAMTDAPWQAAPPGPLNFGFRTDTLWLRLTLQADADRPPLRVLAQIADPMLDEVDVYVLHGKALARTLHLGDARPHGNRPLFHRHFLVPLEFADTRVITLYLRIRTDGTLQVPMRIREPATFTEHEQVALGTRGLVLGAIFTVLATLLLANLTTRHHGFGLSLTFMLCQLVFQAGSDGLAAQYIWTDNVWWNQHVLAIAVCLVMASGIASTASFLDTARTMPALDPWLYTAAIVFLLLLSGTLMLPAGSTYPVLLVLALAGAALMLAIGALAVYRRLPLAHVFTLAMATFLTGLLASTLNQLGLVDNEMLRSNVMLAAILIQAMLYALALAMHLQHAKQQRLQAQAEAISTQEAAVDRQREVKEALKARIDERSAELWAAMRTLEATHSKLGELSRRDGLTGVHNRRHFDERCPVLMQLASRRGQPLAVLLIDIDHFKTLNDTHGHAVGDEALRRVAALLQTSVTRSGDVVARYGGEEFAVLLPDTDREEALTVAENIREAIAGKSIVIDRTELRVTASIGLSARIPVAGEAADIMIGEADKALYLAKHNGRNRTEAYA